MLYYRLKGWGISREGGCLALLNGCRTEKYLDEG
jgi:hypothetical protein